MKEDQRKITDENLREKILEANGDFNKLCDIKREYMKGADDIPGEQLRRTHIFCCKKSAYFYYYGL